MGSLCEVSQLLLTKPRLSLAHYCSYSILAAGLKKNNNLEVGLARSMHAIHPYHVTYIAQLNIRVPSAQTKARRTYLELFLVCVRRKRSSLVLELEQFRVSFVVGVSEQL